MPRNGSGVYSLPSSSWNPAVDGTIIDSTDWNTNVAADLEGALTQSISKDGQTAYVNNQPMGNNKLTGLAAGAVATDSVNLGQVQSGAYEEGVVGGTADVITLAVSPVISAYAKGQVFWFTASGTNTTAVTVNVSSLGAKDLQANGVALVAGDIVSGRYYGARYDGTQFQLLTSHATVMHTADIADSAITSAKLATNAKTGAVRAVTGTTDTILSTDRGKLVTYSNGSSIAVTLPQATTDFTTPFMFSAQNLNTGVVTITPTTSTIDGAASLTLSQNQGVEIYSDGTNYFTQRGRQAFSTGYRAATSGTTVIASDNGGVINFTTAGATLALTAAATLGAGFKFTVWNSAATGDVTVDPDSAETIDGAATRVLRPGNRATIVSDGTNWRTSSGIYSSAPAAITTSSSDSFAHLFPVRPQNFGAYIIADATPELGYTAGDYVNVEDFQNGSSNARAVSVKANGTNIVITWGSSTPFLLDLGTFSAAAIDVTKWTVVLWAQI